jgi:hypothetical protein
MTVVHLNRAPDTNRATGTIPPRTAAARQRPTEGRTAQHWEGMDMPERNRIATGGDKKHRKGDSFEYRLLLAASLPIFLVAAIVGRVLPSGEHAVPGERLSVIGEARAAADTYVPFAFMG